MSTNTWILKGLTTLPDNHMPEPVREACLRMLEHNNDPDDVRDFLVEIHKLGAVSPWVRILCDPYFTMRPSYMD